MRPGDGRDLWQKAKTIIPGGSQLLSKRSEMFLPDLWPSYYSRAKGAEIWDLAGRRYVDMSIMGVGACILGYADPDVNRAVHQAVDRGSMATLNCPEEVELAELLLRLHPWGGMVRYTRTGGEAMAAAVRIARAFSGQDTVAFCGYHGWHDWYLAANLAEDRNLDGHLLPGLAPKGVPRGLRDTAIPFTYNRLDELEAIVDRHRVGAIVMEPLRHDVPEPGFLEGVRRIADEEHAVLVFDEITTGWRECLGGSHQLLHVVPEIVVYAKAMSNGFPMAAIVGKTEVMESAQESFISSTFWTERIGPVAALATIRKLERCRVPDHLRKVGTLLATGLKREGERYGIPLQTVGIPALTTLQFAHPQGQVMQTLYTQELLKRGYLASRNFYACHSHTERMVEEFLGAAGEVLGQIRENVARGDLEATLEGPVAHTGFRRLN
jgi:glutamate-1-semialdehyde aminotransferase